MPDLALVNSPAFGFKLASMFGSAFQARFERLIDLIDRVEVAPTSDEILEVLGCTRAEFMAYLALLDAIARHKGGSTDAAIFPGFPLDVVAELHPVPGTESSTWTLRRCSTKGAAE